MRSRSWLVAVVGTIAVIAVDAPLAAAQVKVGGVYAEPRAVLTPGKADPRVTQATLRSTVCVPGYTASVRPSTGYTNPVKDRQMSAYGYAGRARADFELDHLIPLELGGDPRAVANLWPQPWEHAGGRILPDGYGAETKDDFEDYLKRAVCAGRLRLVDAQQQMAHNWIANAQRAGIAAGSQAVPAHRATTAKPAAATTTPGRCHPSYTPCVPIASDVDCLGGSGNGPAYIAGPVKVIGPDEYGLDADHDGIGCE